MPDYVESQERQRTPPPDYDEEPAPDYEKQSYLLVPELESAEFFVGEAVKRLRNGRSPWTLLVPTAEHAAQCKPMLAKEQREWTRRFNSPYPIPADDAIQVRAYEGTGILGSLNPDSSTLYIEAHGAPGDPRLGFKIDGRWIIRSMKEMAEELRKHGLRRDFGDIRLLACNSGDRGPDGGPSAAEQLRHCMQEAGLGNVGVSGYLGAVQAVPRIDDNGRMYSTVGDQANQNIERRSRRRVRFPADPGPE